MKPLSSLLFLSVLCLSVGVLVACHGQGSQITPGTVPIEAGRSPLRVDVGDLARAGIPSRLRLGMDRSASWIDPAAKMQDLLYISNVYTVTVYTYPRGRHVGTLKGFYRPVGECTDAAGNVFIANANAVLEYQHGGKKPINELTLSGYTPEGCGVDFTTGDLAVTWYQSESSPNYVAIYSTPSSTPNLYTMSGVSFVFCAYDANGDLFIDGYSGEVSSNFVLSELPKGAGNLKAISVGPSFEHPGAVQWDGKYLAVGDDEAQKIYRFAIASSGASLRGTVDLGNAETVYQWWIDGKKVIGSDDIPSTVRYWPYPGGGSAIKSITKDVFHPYGATVSKASHE